MIYKDAVLTVIGVGGSGCNAIKYMAGKEALDETIRLIAVNTDNQSLDQIESNISKIQIGSNVTRGRGAGADPMVGKKSAEDDEDLIRSCIEDSDMIFITTGMGGGTGTGASPVVAKVGRELGILVIAVVTLPFDFEGSKKRKIAEAGVAELKEYVDAIILVPNQKLFEEISGDIQLNDAFEASNDVLLNGVQGISDIIVKGGLINIDFNDVKTVMSNSGYAMLGVGKSNCDDTDKAKAATLRAIDCPLLEINNLDGASGIIVNITSDGTLTLSELQYIGDIVREIADEDATIIVGTSIDPLLNGEMKVTIIATNLAPEVKTIDNNHRFKNTSNVKSSSSRVAEDFRNNSNTDVPLSTLGLKGLKRESKLRNPANFNYDPSRAGDITKAITEQLVNSGNENQQDKVEPILGDKFTSNDDDFATGLGVDINGKTPAKINQNEAFNPRSYNFLKKFFNNKS